MLLAGSMIELWYHCRFKYEMHDTPWNARFTSSSI